MNKKIPKPKNRRLADFPKFNEFVEGAHNAMLGNSVAADYNPYIGEVYLKAYARAEEHLRDIEHLQYIDPFHLGDLHGTLLANYPKDFYKHVLKEDVLYICELFNEHHAKDAYE
jgi:hypothetical protein